MTNLLNLQQYKRPYLTDIELYSCVNATSKASTANSRYGIVKRLIAQGKILHIRRGLYCLTDKIGCIVKPYPYELAQYIYGPSYISLETALSFHKLIPETVYTFTNVTIKRTKEFNTPLGLFNYVHLPVKNFYTSVELIIENSYQFFMAKPWKAICDYVFCSKKDWDLTSLLDNLRINYEDLPELRNEEMELLEEYYDYSRVSLFLKAVKKYER